MVSFVCTALASGPLFGLFSGMSVGGLCFFAAPYANELKEKIENEGIDCNNSAFCRVDKTCLRHRWMEFTTLYAPVVFPVVIALIGQWKRASHLRKKGAGSSPIRQTSMLVKVNTAAVSASMLVKAVEKCFVNELHDEFDGQELDQFTSAAIWTLVTISLAIQVPLERVSLGLPLHLRPSELIKKSAKILPAPAPELATPDEKVAIPKRESAGHVPIGCLPWVAFIKFLFIVQNYILRPLLVLDGLILKAAGVDKEGNESPAADKEGNESKKEENPSKISKIATDAVPPSSNA